MSAEQKMKDHLKHINFSVKCPICSRHTYEIVSVHGVTPEGAPIASMYMEVWCCSECDTDFDIHPYTEES